MNSNHLTTPLFKRVEIKVYAECVLLLEFDQAPIADIHRLVKSLSETANFFGIIELVPGYASLMLVCQTRSQRHFLHEQLVHLFHDNDLLQPGLQEHNAQNPSRLIEVPVCYDPCLAPDLESLAASKSKTIEELITLHAEPKYLVCMLGFVPGFMYLSGLNEALSAPRLDKPRTQIAAGSVAIGGSQTGIYPFDMPGGWHIIGRTPIQLNNLEKQQFGIAKPMDTIRFVPISLAEFNRTNQYD